MDKITHFNFDLHISNKKLRGYKFEVGKKVTFLNFHFLNCKLFNIYPKNVANGISLDIAVSLNQ